MFTDKPTTFHINGNSEVKVCVATVRGCTFGKHYVIWNPPPLEELKQNIRYFLSYNAELPHPETLYHGSPNVIKPGGIIKPGKHKGVAFATGQLNTAKSFAKHSHGRIYLVEPLSTSPEFTRTLPMRNAPPGTIETTCAAGFRVVAEIAHFDSEGKRVHKTMFDKCKICNSLT